ncbi:MAG: hypothetical protein J6I66_04365 [Lachnospiraceae bacterium]|nr:hypothetical protein [Lachnospiraceae bacterium]
MNKRLGKLEYNETKKLFTVFTVILVVYQIICIILGLISRNTSSEIPSDTIVIITICSALGIIMCSIIMIKRFYNILFSAEGSIRLAMPVKNSEHQKVNIKTALIWIYIMFAIFIIGIGLTEVTSGERIYGVANTYRNYIESYTVMDRLPAPALKAVITIVFDVLTMMVIIATLYISCIFAVTIASRISGRFNILQKNGVLFIVVVVLYNIKALFLNNLYHIFNYVVNRVNRSPVPLSMYAFQLILDISCVIVYGLSAIAMYRIGRSILNKKLDI